MRGSMDVIGDASKVMSENRSHFTDHERGISSRLTACKLRSYWHCDATNFGTFSSEERGVS